MKKQVRRLLVLAVAVGMLATSILGASAAFDAAYYAQQNPDVVKALGNSPAMLKLHYDMFGRQEARMSNKNDTEAQLRRLFKADEYAKFYPDVKKAFGDNKELMFQHYIAFGLLESRRPSEKVSQAAAASLKKTVEKAMKDAGIAATPGSPEVVAAITGEMGNVASAGGANMQQALTQVAAVIAKEVTAAVKEVQNPAPAGGGSSGGLAGQQAPQRPSGTTETPADRIAREKKAAEDALRDLALTHDAKDSIRTIVMNTVQGAVGSGIQAKWKDNETVNKDNEADTANWKVTGKIELSLAGTSATAIVDLENLNSGELVLYTATNQMAQLVTAADTAVKALGTTVDGVSNVKKQTDDDKLKEYILGVAIDAAQAKIIKGTVEGSWTTAPTLQRMDNSDSPKDLTVTGGVITLKLGTTTAATAVNVSLTVKSEKSILTDLAGDVKTAVNALTTVTSNDQTVVKAMVEEAVNAKIDSAESTNHVKGITADYTNFMNFTAATSGAEGTYKGTIDLKLNGVKATTDEVTAKIPMLKFSAIKAKTATGTNNLVGQSYTVSYNTLSDEVNAMLKGLSVVGVWSGQDIPLERKDGSVIGWTLDASYDEKTPGTKDATFKSADYTLLANNIYVLDGVTDASVKITIKVEKGIIETVKAANTANDKADFTNASSKADDAIKTELAKLVLTAEYGDAKNIEIENNADGWTVKKTDDKITAELRASTNVKVKNTDGNDTRFELKQNVVLCTYEVPPT